MSRFLRPASRFAGSALLRSSSRAALPTITRFGQASIVAQKQFSVGFSRCFSAEAGSFLARDEVQTRVIAVISGFDKVDEAKVNPAAHFMNDLGLDSLDTVELVMAIEEEFGLEIPDAEAEKIVTCEDAIQYVATHPNAK
mmetsp:Transcript_7276/g.16131  ORF Transcript_7276/g.16131 Transcript_7276/m.16131 type:complete len:140 (-) Transcript_7276:83-502(-)